MFEICELERIITRVAGVKGCESITEYTNLINDLGFDSIQLVELVVEIEKAYSIEFKDEDLNIDILQIYGGLLNTVKRLIGEKNDSRC